MKLIRIVLAGVLAAAPSLAAATVYTDDLGRCLVEATTPADRGELMKWTFAAYAASDAAREIVTLTPEQHAAFNRRGATLFERLLFVDCRKQAIAAIRNDGPASLQQAFQTLGIIAGRGLAEDPAVSRELQSFAAMIDPAKTRALMSDAGVAPKGK